jgi:hypothetical protein
MYVMKKLLFVLSLSLISWAATAGAAGAAAAPTPSTSASAYNFDVGLLAGVGILNNGGGSPFTYGIEADYLIDPSWSVGLLFNALTPNSASLAGTSYSLGLSNLELAIKYIIDGWNVGILFGFNTFTTNIPGASGGSYMNYGLTTGYDFQLGSGFSVGPQLDFLWTSQSSGFQETDIMAAIKYSF